MSRSIHQQFSFFFFFSIAGDLFVVVFSLDCRESFEEAIRLRESILETKVSATQSATKSRSKSHFNLKVPMVIVGNKCDKDTKYVSLFQSINVFFLNNDRECKISIVLPYVYVKLFSFFLSFLPCFLRTFIIFTTVSRVRSFQVSVT